MNCCRPVDGVCVQCGEPLSATLRRYCPKGPKADRAPTRRVLTPGREREPRPPCAWLGQPTDQVALVKCETCRGNVRKKKTLYDCALFGRCLPRGRGETDAAQCATCRHHTGRR